MNNKKNRILLTGATGQVGSEILKVLSPLDYELILGLSDLSRAKEFKQHTVLFDLKNLNSLQKNLFDIKPDLVINPAAYTQVDKAEDEKELCELINFKSTELIAETLEQLGSSLIHFSTDYVYGVREPRAICESDPKDPLGVYAKTKLQADEAIESLHSNYLILRTSWVYGRRGQNFVSTMLKLARDKEELRVVSDQIGAPSNARTLAEAVFHILEKTKADFKDYKGVYNICDQGETSWYGFAREIFKQAKALGHSLAIQKVHPILTRDYPTKAKRPLNSRLDTSKIRSKFDLKIPSWDESLNASFVNFLG